MKLTFEFDDDWWNEFLRTSGDGLHIIVSPYTTNCGYGHMTRIDVERESIVERQAGYRRPIARHYEVTESFTVTEGTSELYADTTIPCKLNHKGVV